MIELALLAALALGAEPTAAADVASLPFIPGADLAQFWQRADSTPTPAAVAQGKGCASVAFVIEHDGSVSAPRVVHGNPPKVHGAALAASLVDWKFRATPANPDALSVFTLHTLVFGAATPADETTLRAGCDGAAMAVLRSGKSSDDTVVDAAPAPSVTAAPAASSGPIVGPGPDLPFATFQDRGRYWRPVATPWASFPAMARKAKVDGCVSVGYVIEADGSVSNARALFSVPPNLFSDAGVAATEKWRFEPAAENAAKQRIYSVATHAFAFKKRLSDTRRKVLIQRCEPEAFKALGVAGD